MTYPDVTGRRREQENGEAGDELEGEEENGGDAEPRMKAVSVVHGAQSLRVPDGLETHPGQQQRQQMQQRMQQLQSPFGDGRGWNAVDHQRLSWDGKARGVCGGVPKSRFFLVEMVGDGGW